MYWTSAGATLRLPTTAITQTEPTTITALVKGAVQLLMGSDVVFALTPANGIWKITKPNGGASLFVSGGNVGANPANMQTDGGYLYWMTGGTLKRIW